VNLVEGTATFDSENSVRVSHSGEGQGSESIEFEHCIVATGSRPIQIPNFEFADDAVLSSRDALDLDTVPDELVVVGAGYIGMELSTVFAKLGTDVTVVEMLDGVLPGYEDDVAKPVADRADELGIDFHFGYTAAGWEEAGDGIVVTAEPAATDGGAAAAEEAETLDLAADKVLVAVGRQPVTDTLDLEAAGLETDDRGFLETDDRARTEHDHIFAIGDVAGEPMLAHKASKEGEVAAEVIAGEPSALDYQAMPAAVFTDPEIGTVGMTEEEAADAGFDPVVGQMPFRASGRALTTGETDGFVRIVADDDSGFVLGAQIVGPEASELVAELALAMEMGATLEDVYSTVHTHPTLAEAVMEAAANARGHAIHTLNR
jgi:dihydrolipoamide dehydrogenase